MKPWRAVVLMAAALAGCALSSVAAEDLTWGVACPKAVDRGAEFSFTVGSYVTNSGGITATGVEYRYQILWPGGSSNPLRHKGRTGEPQKVHARLEPGTATLVVTCENRAGQETKFAGCTFEVR